MSKKIHHGVTLWSFLDQLWTAIIEPTTFEIAQIKNKLQVRAAASKKTLLTRKILDSAEKKLSRGQFTVMHFLNQMAHQFAKCKLTSSDLRKLSNEEEDTIRSREQAEIAAIEEERQAEASLAAQNTLPVEISCKVCRTQKISHMMIPCFCVCVCELCAHQLNANLVPSCPNCFADVHIIQKITFAF
jgi:hypothetical protein